LLGLPQLHPRAAKERVIGAKSRSERPVDGLEQLSDEELIRRSREQPAQAARCIDVLFERAYPRVAQWCLRCSPNRDEAADLAQEVILRAYTRLESFRLESRFSTWLYTISRRVAIDRGIVRRRQDARTAPEEAADGVENGTPVAELVEQQQIGEAVRDAMAADLDPLEAQVVYLHYVDGLSLPAITEMLDFDNKSGAKAYLVGGMRKLRRRFRPTAESESTSP
jgi:RNA polymerase sigma-70 factor (ECF subfamily)